MTAINSTVIFAVNSAITSTITTTFTKFSNKHDADIQSLRSLIRNLLAGKQPIPPAGKQPTSSTDESHPDTIKN